MLNEFDNLLIKRRSCDERYNVKLNEIEQNDA